MSKKPLKTIRTICLLALVLLQACTDKAPPSKKGFDPNQIYYEYQVMGAEGEDSVACRLQCRRGGPTGPTILLGADTTVRVDSVALIADSAGFSGYYYEAQLPAAGFAGAHRWTIGRDQIPFHFVQFGLAQLPPALHRDELNFQLTGLDKNDRLYLLLVDTAWASNDLSAVLPVEKGGLQVPASRLASLKPGPITLELSHDQVTPLTGGRAGTQRVVYGLRRSFDLVD